MTLWTPDGERRVGADTPDPKPDPTAEQLSPEQEDQAREMAREMAQAREQLLEAEVATVVANHALGIYELAALHITSERPDLVEARLAVDALGVLVDGLKGRLGDAEPTLVDALSNIKIAYVQRANQLKQERAAASGGTAESGETAPDAGQGSDSTGSDDADTDDTDGPDED